MLGITHLRHISLLTPKIEEQTEFYENVWGLDPVHKDEDNVYFRGAGSEHHIVNFKRSDQKGLHHVAFGLTDQKAVDNAFRKLKEQNVRIVTEPGYIDEAGGGYGFRFLDHEGRCIQLSTWVEIHTVEWKKKNCDPIKLNHVVFNTTDLDQSVKFYTDVLGFKVTDWSERQMVFLRCNKNHHVIAFNLDVHTSVNHIAYEVEGVDEVMRGLSNVKAAGYSQLWGPGRHGPGNNIFTYYQDPAGYVMEYTCYITKVENDDEWQALVWKRVPHLMDLWGTAGRPPVEARAAMCGEPDAGWATTLFDEKEIQL